LTETYLEAFIAQVYQNVGKGLYSCTTPAKWYAMKFDRPTQTIPFEDVVVGSGEKVRLILNSTCSTYDGPVQRLKIQRSPANQNVWSDVGDYSEKPNGSYDYIHNQFTRLDQPSAGTYDYRVLVCVPSGTGAYPACVWDPVNYSDIHTCDFYLQVFGGGGAGKVEARTGLCKT
jgi:hypothetical protein